ncbi:MAG TPA: HlyD family efflux transporter periplasmic adaptor subunit [Pseudonocardiaceae bacterium]|nr:HlyD family efflux transporter periplasmic adaptor subunit [Pseudonocardiaceae bacterium]
MADRRRGGFRLRRRGVIVVGIVVVVVGGGAAGAWAAMRPSGPDYRLATAGPAAVTDSLAGTGTIQPVTQATVMFPTSGQVASVGVQAGQHVTEGQTLAQLNTTSLDATVSRDRQSVASAQVRLADDQNSQTSVTASAPQATSPSSAGSSTPAGGSARLSGMVHGLSADQNAVRRAQQKVDADLALVAAADHEVNAQGAACQALLDQLRSATTTPPTTTPTSTTTPPPPPPGGSTSVTDCESLINEVLTDESTTGEDERTLSTSVAALSAALNKAVAAVGTSTTRTGGSHSTQGTQGATRQSTGRSAVRTGGQPASADQIAADQAAVDAANAELAAGQQAVAAATMVSPIAGTVADVTVTAGQSAAANSADAEVVVIGAGQDEVATAVTDSQVGQVKPGDRATVTPDGATVPIAGTVTAVGALGTTTSSGSASYPVTISLGSTSQQLFDGATASVSITLGTAQAAVTVPTSAVTSVGGFSVVTRMVAGKPAITRVTLGVRGPTVTQVTSGLRAGDQVALANMNAPMPTANNPVRIGGGGFGGGGFARAAGRGAGGGGR